MVLREESYLLGVGYHCLTLRIKSKVKFKVREKKNNGQTTEEKNTYDVWSFVGISLAFSEES